MLRKVADGVLIHTSEFVATNTVVVPGRDGVLLVDPGILGDELACLANDLTDAGQAVVAGFSTHPHWDHLLWSPELGEAPRYATARCAETASIRLSGGVDAAMAKAVGIPEEVPLDLLGHVTGLPPEATQIPWDGPEVLIIEHRAHASGHAALFIEQYGVLVAGDMLSDVLVPMLDMSSAHAIEDHLAALRLLDGVADDVDVVIPGHGSIAEGDEVRARIALDMAYLHALRDGQAPNDPRIGPSAKDGWDWVAGVHERQLQQLATSSHGTLGG